MGPYGGGGSGGGSSDPDDSSSALGLIPRVCTDMFSRIASNVDPSVSYSVSVTYLEIYSEKIFDLLDKSKRNLAVRQHPKRGPYVENLTSVRVESWGEMERVLAKGNAERTVAATLMNERSSRSHAVFSILLTRTQRDEEVKLSSDVTSKIQLVDLAGSERAEFSGATGVRLREAANINKSLLTLGRVVSALAARSQHEAARASSGGGGGASSPRGGGTGGSSESDPTFVPFRDSVLTWLLSESLGGNSKVRGRAARRHRRHRRGG